MEIWSGLGTALLAAGVSFLTAIAFRFWDERRARWTITGLGHPEYHNGVKVEGRRSAKIEVHNAGDGDAFGVETERCNGSAFESWRTFEAGRVAPGGMFEFSMSVPSEHWDTAWFELRWQTGSMRKPKTKVARYLLKDVLVVYDDLPVRGNVIHRYRPEAQR